MRKSRGRGRSSGPSQPQTTTTRGRGRPPKQPSVASTVGSSRSTTAAAKKRNKGLTVNGKKPWDDSDEEVYNQPDYFSASEDEVDDADRDPDFNVKTEVLDELEDDFDELRHSFGTPVYNDLDEPQPCPWAEGVECPPLDLPRASYDLMTTNEQLLDLIQIYETLSTYYQAIQLTPFIFEDFCAAMRSVDPSKLVAEIHVALLKCLLRDDDDEQTIYAVTDTSVSFQLVVHCLEPTTYGEFLRQYVESDARFPQHIADICRKNYPYGPIEDKITVLLWLTDRFYETGCFRKIVKAEGKIVYNETCRECCKPGDVILCDNCDACYHQKCIHLDTVPAGTWFCPTCQMNSVHGVTDCFLPGERIGKTILNRMPLGYDRHGRIYWFCVRRLIVTDPNTHETRFYSTLPAIFDVVSRFDPTYYEARLCRAIYAIIDSIAEHTLMTLNLTRFRQKEMKARFSDRANSVPEIYLEKDNTYRMMYLTYNVVNDPSLHGYPDTTQEVFSGEALRLNLFRKFAEHLGFEYGQLVQTDWTYGINQDQLLQRRMEFVQAMSLPADTRSIPYVVGYISELNIAFRLSFTDQQYREYENFFETNDNTRPPAQRIKEKDRRKYMATRFCIDEPFNWGTTKGKDMFVYEALVIRHIQITLRRFVDRLPVELFHRLWRGQNKEIFMRKLQAAHDVEAVKQCLLQFEAVLRRPVFVNPWWSSLGHTKLLRVTTTDRDKRQALDAKRKKAERELATADINDVSNDIVWVKFNSKKPQNKTILRVKGEQYRVNGKEQLGGWQWVSNEYRKVHVETLEKPKLGVNFATPVQSISFGRDGVSKVQPTTKATRKAIRLDKIVKKLTTWRETQVVEAQKSTLKCYSPSCGKPSGSSVNGVPTGCYSVSCPWRSKVVQDSSTAAVAKAYLPSRRRAFLEKLARQTSATTPGEGQCFRFPRPFDYIHRGSKQANILVLPKFAIEKLARTGGLKLTTPLPGYHRNAKTNYAVWNYPCPRPLFDTCWRYLTHKANTIHALALQIRMLFCSIRWFDLEPDWEPEDPRHVVHHPEHDEIRVVIGHKEYPPDGFYERYKLRVELVALEDEGIPPALETDVVISNDDNEGDAKNESTSSVKPTRKSTRRKTTRKAAETALHLRNNVSRRVVERWMDGIDLKLFEIAEYWKNFNKRAAAIKKVEPKPKPVPAPKPAPAPRAAPSRPVKPTPTTVPESRKRLRDAVQGSTPAPKKPRTDNNTISIRRGDQMVKYKYTPTANAILSQQKQQQQQMITTSDGRQFQFAGASSSTVYTPTSSRNNGAPTIYSVVQANTVGGVPMVRIPGQSNPIRIIRKTVPANGIVSDPNNPGKMIRIVSGPGESGQPRFIRVTPGVQFMRRAVPRFPPANSNQSVRYIAAPRPVIVRQPAPQVIINGAPPPQVAQQQTQASSSSQPPQAEQNGHVP